MNSIDSSNPIEDELGNSPRLPEMEERVGWLLLCDDDKSSAAGTEWVYYWNGYSATTVGVSLLDYVEENAERLRRVYLAWIHDLGETKIKGRRLVDRLTLADGLSHWWLTPLAEKSLYKTDLSSAIKFLALEEIVNDLKPAGIRVVSEESVVHETVRDFCDFRRISFQGEWSLQPLSKRRSWWRRLPATMLGMAFLLRHIIQRGSLRGTGTGIWAGGEEGLFLGSYFFHFQTKQAETGVFESGYWAQLPDLLKKQGRKANWLQLFYRHDGVPDARTGFRLIESLNRPAAGAARHRFLDAYLSSRVVCTVSWRWLRLVVRSWNLPGIKRAFRPSGNGISLWPLMREDWSDSLRGAGAMQGLIFQALLDCALRDIPTQRNGFYLCENQGWERAMIHAWRKHGHGKLTGVAHATLRFWDLRYFDDPRRLQENGPGALPQPDRIALNGDAAFDAARLASFPDERLVACEALRYNYLHRIRSRVEQNRSATTPRRILILGDYLASSTQRMLKMLEEAVRGLRTAVSYTIKPHPNLSVLSSDYPRLDLQVTDAPLAQLLSGFDTAFSSNLTSASVDAFCGGLKVIVMLDNHELNFSPLRKCTGVKFVASASALATVLTATQPAEFAKEARDYFYLDPKLPRWSALLSE